MTRLILIALVLTGCGPTSEFMRIRITNTQIVEYETNTTMGGIKLW